MYIKTLITSLQSCFYFKNPSSANVGYLHIILFQLNQVFFQVFPYAAIVPPKSLFLLIFALCTTVPKRNEFYRFLLHVVSVRPFPHEINILYSSQAYIWEQWHAIIEPYATILPYMVGIGNHEQDHLKGGSKDPSGAPGEGFHPWWSGGWGYDSGGECGVPMYYRFHMPDNGNAVWW